jgi:2-polyprenyl-3-methyl-5-hydroxy-6-metoxy-1,4-benzoquinol methylase
MRSLRQRHRRAELMDGPGLNAGQHAAALRGLARLNLFGSVSVLWPPLAALAARAPGRPLRVIDFATGGGDIPLRLWRRARRSGVAFGIDGCDRSEFAVAHATAAAEQVGADVRFFVHDALRDGPLTGYDAAVCSLFLHHLGDEEAVTFLRTMAASGRAVLVNDLERGVTNFALVLGASRLVTTSSVVHTDALRSVRAAFTLEEARLLAERAGLRGATAVRRRPCRFLLSWERP